MSRANTEWLPDEIARREQVESGLAVVANLKRDKALISWATARGLLVRIGRPGKWGNPFVMGPDGNRDEVCDAFNKWLPPELAEQAARELRGKVLACYCYPNRCHGERLAQIANGRPTLNRPGQKGFASAGELYNRIKHQWAAPKSEPCRAEISKGGPAQ